MASAEPATDPHTFVVHKLVRIFGEARAQTLLADVLQQAGIDRVATIDQMEQVARILERRGGFEATVGVMLNVQVSLERMSRRVPH